MYQIRGQKKQLVFTANDFVAKGGEGSVYKKGNLVYKIYEDANQMIPEAKIRELQQIQGDNIIKPLDIVIDKSGQIVGFTMSYVKSIALCKLFTTSFRDRKGVTDDMTLELVENIKSGIYEIHNAKCLIVDGNEMNYLVNDQDFITPYFIDVNTWQTPSFPATAINPSIRDWRSKTFNEVTDWFSFAIVAFQLFVGIHPFKGRYKGYKKNDFEKRVRDCVSVLHKGVKFPPAVRDFGLIPTHYKDWFFNLFEKGQRTLPPAAPGARGPVTMKVIVIHDTNNFEIKELYRFSSKILFNTTLFGQQITKTKHNLHIDNKQYRVSPGTEILFTPKYLTPILAKVENYKSKLKSLRGDIKYTELACSEMMIVDNTLYAKHGEKLMELNFIEMDDRTLVAVKTTWGVMPYSSEVFSGVVVQNVFGRSFLVIPRPSVSGNSECFVPLIQELDGYRVLDAKHESRVCFITAFKDNKYFRFILKFNDRYEKYTCRIIEDIDSNTPINFVVLDNGIVISITDDEVIEIFSNKYLKDDIKEIHDPDIDTTMKLTKDGILTRFFKGQKLYSIKMK